MRYQIAIYHFPTNFYDFSELIKRDLEGLDAQYKRLQAENHPLFTGTVAFKVRATSANSIEESNKVAAMFESGADIEAVREAFNVTANPLRDGKRWIPAMPKNVNPLPDYNAEYWRKKFPQWISELEVGQVLGPEIRWLNPKMGSVGQLVFNYFQIVAKADTGDSQPGKGFSAEAKVNAFRGIWVKRVFETNRYEELQKQLREKAEIKVDGRVVSANIVFSGCGDLTPESALFEEAKMRKDAGEHLAD